MSDTSDRSAASAASARILALPASRLIVIDLHLSVDGVGHQQRVTWLLDELRAAADVDRDGDLRWGELLQSDQVRHGQFGITVADSEETRQQLIYTHDINRNERVEAAEALALLLKDLPGRARLLDLDAAAAPAGDDHGRSQGDALFRWLDSDRNGTLTDSELRDAPARLRSVDRNADGQVTLNELLVFSSATGLERNASSADARRWAYLLSDATDWSGLLFAIEERYAYGSPLQPGDMANGDQLFREIDVDGDGQWSVEETRCLATRPADYAFRIDLGDDVRQADERDANEPRDVSLESSMLDVVRQPLDGGSTLRLVRVPDVADPANALTLDPQFREIDGDGSGDLDESEYARILSMIQVPWPYVGGKRDDRLSQQALRSLLEQREAAQRCRLLLRFQPDEQPLWHRMDEDGDERLTSRELASLPTRLASLLASDARPTHSSPPAGLSPSMLPTDWLLLIGRGETLDQRGAFATGAPRAEASGGPVAEPVAPWFQAMDRNRDGELDASEFLGEAARFTQFDRDGDNFIKWSEAATAIVDAP